MVALINHLLTYLIFLTMRWQAECRRLLAYSAWIAMLHWCAVKMICVFEKLFVCSLNGWRTDEDDDNWLLRTMAETLTGDEYSDCTGRRDISRIIACVTEISTAVDSWDIRYQHFYRRLGDLVLLHRTTSRSGEERCRTVERRVRAQLTYKNDCIAIHSVHISVCRCDVCKTHQPTDYVTVCGIPLIPGSGRYVG